MKDSQYQAAIGVVAVLVAVFLLYRLVGKYDWDAVWQAFGTAKPVAILAAAAFTVGSFACLFVMESLAVFHTARAVPIPRIAATAVAALGIGHSLGLAALSSGAIRYRMYGRAGLRLGAIGRILLFSGFSVSLGFSLAGAALLIWRTEEISKLFGIGTGLLWLAAGGACSFIAAYIACCAIWHRRFYIWHFRFRLPSPRIALAQVVVTSLNVLCCSGVLYFSLNAVSSVDFPTAATLYVGADVAATAGHVPGGWGIMEYIVTESLEGPEVVAGVILYRAIYFLAPLAIGWTVFLGDELASRRTGRPVRSRPNAVADAT